jgi:hypothetical protein
MNLKMGNSNVSMFFAFRNLKGGVTAKGHTHLHKVILSETTEKPTTTGKIERLQGS